MAEAENVFDNGYVAAAAAVVRMRRSVEEVNLTFVAPEQQDIPFRFIHRSNAYKSTESQTLTPSTFPKLPWPVERRGALEKGSKILFSELHCRSRLDGRRVGKIVAAAAAAFRNGPGIVSSKNHAAFDGRTRHDVAVPLHIYSRWAMQHG